ncbi:MAG: VWA domain-containing protein [Acidobacteriaceae bacterium]|nr:VWA domain-containing protein [Acidobacteriaceae bacterium]
MNMTLRTLQTAVLPRFAAAALCCTLALPTALLAQQPPPSGYVIKVQTELVLTNVIVRDKKTGEIVKGLKGSDFTILENGKPQKIQTFDFENVDAIAQAQPQQTVSGQLSATALLDKAAHPDVASLRDHRLIVMFFDLSSMQVDDLDRAVEAAQDFVNQKMQPADLVALVSMGTSLSVDQDFTADRTSLLHHIGIYNGSEGQGMANGVVGGGTDDTSDDASSYVPDDSEYNSLNTDRELYAIRTIAKSLERVDQRKSLLYFSGGLTRNGIENEASLRAAVSAAVHANISIYSVDSRGLQALPPVGDASKGSMRGTGAYSGKAMQSQLNANFSSQETLATLSTDTGGTAFFDSNDFAPAFQKIQQDTSAYYILGYRSTNAARDGKFRNLTVKMNRSDVKLEYRPGYYAPADFQHSNTEDRELQLTQQLQSDLPATDVAVYLQALYFRLDEGHFYVPLSLVVPGSQIPFIQNGDRDKATLDIDGIVKNGQGLTVGSARDTVKLAVDASQQVRSKNIQYQTGFVLVPGNYHLKFVVRENQTGRMGSFETDIRVPDFKKTPLKLSSVVMASQQTQNAKAVKKDPNPLIRDGVAWVPNVPHVFRQDQHLYVLYEVYDPTRSKTAPADKPVRVLTSLEFLNAGVKVYETPVVESDVINVPERGAVAFQLDVPLAQLKPGNYTTQVNVIDDVGGSFSFPRAAIVIQPAAAAPAMPAPASH